jgi:hypothetical protein
MKLRPTISPATFAAVVIITLSNMSVDASAQVTSPWVKLARGPAFEINTRATAGDNPLEVTVPIPLTLLPEIKPEEVTVKLLDVRLGNRYAQGLAEAFTLTEKVAMAKGRGVFIPVKIDLSKALVPGTYNMLIEATTPSKSPAQLLDLQLVHPAAKFKSPTTLVVERVLTPFFEPEVSGLSMTLSEDSGLTSVTGLTFTARDFIGDNGQIIDGTIKCPNPPNLIGAGGAEKLIYELHGGFPLGTSRGTVEIRSPQLAEAFPIAFEVRTRRASWLILLVIALGLVVGYLLRTLLQQRIKLGEVRLQGFDLRDRMRSEMARRPDEPLKSKIKAAVDKLNVALAARQADALTKAITDADTELRDALKQFEDRRNKAQEALDALEKLVKTRWNLPVKVKAAVAEAGELIEGLRAQLLGDNVKVVEDALDQAMTALTLNLVGALKDWRTAQEGSLELLDNRYLPDAVSAAVSKDVTDARTLLDQAADLDESPTVGDMSAALGAAHKARASLSDLFGKLQRWLRYELTEFLKTLRKTALPNASVLDELEQTATNLLDELNAQSGAEGAATVLTPERLSELNAVWRDALEKQMEGAGFSDEEKLKMTPLLDARKYAEAARAALVILEQKRREKLSGNRGAADSVIEVVAASAPPSNLANTAAREVADAPTPPRVVRAEHIPAPVEPSQSQTYRQLLREKFLLFALSGLGIALVGFLLFQGKFVGTFADLAGIFLWAFGLDVTIDTFMRIAKTAEPRAGS